MYNHGKHEENSIKGVPHTKFMLEIQGVLKQHNKQLPIQLASPLDNMNIF